MKRILIVLVTSFFIVNLYSQDSLIKIEAGIGLGVIYYPEGKIYGYTHCYYANYIFSKHFGANLSLDFGEGQIDDEYYFDLSKSTAIGAGLKYIPFKNKKTLQLNTSFSISKNTRVFGTKDEIVNSSSALSKFTSYESFMLYGLNLGLQYPILEKNDFLFAAKADMWASWLKIDAASFKFLINYKF